MKKIYSTIIDAYNLMVTEISKPIKIFLLKAVLLFLGWKIIYTIFLYDNRLLDTPLTMHIGDATAYVLNLLPGYSNFSSVPTLSNEILEGERTLSHNSTIFHNGDKVMGIATPCNGLELIILYIGFIIAMPHKLIRKILFIIYGVLIIDLANIMRCVGLAYIKEEYHPYFNFAHHYLFKITIYCIIFLLWVAFAKKIKLSNENI
jgi:exosortase/archaeosortase family protein